MLVFQLCEIDFGGEGRPGVLAAPLRGTALAILDRAVRTKLLKRVASAIELRLQYTGLDSERQMG